MPRSGAIALLMIGLTANVWACSDTKLFSLGASASTTAASIQTLFPEVRVQFDAKSATLEATGCPDQLAGIESLVEAASKNDPARWRSEVAKRLWNSCGGTAFLKHSQLGFSLQRPPAEWKIVSVLPDHACAARLQGKPVFGLKFALKQDTLMFLAVDLDRIASARQIGEPDAVLPLELWPQAVTEKHWAETILGEFLAPRGGLHTPNKSSYRARMLWNTGPDKLVWDRVYLAQPFADGGGTRLYLFMVTLAKTEYQSHAFVLPNFVAGFTMPDSLEPAAVAEPGPAVNQITPVVKQISRKSLPARVQYEWQLEKSPSPSAQAALEASRAGAMSDAEQLWTKLLPGLPHALRSEALWFLARAQDGQGKTRQAIATLDRLIRESFAGHPLLFEAVFLRGHYLGHRLRQWDAAAIEWKQAATLARDEHQQWQAATRLATVPYYKRQTQQAIDALETVLREYPTRETADFVAPYLWYLKNCAQKHI